MSFGLNKVQYTPFKWQRIQTKHFDIYFSQEGDSIAHFAAKYVEEMYSDLSTKLGHSLHIRVPIILHNNHIEFQQTNVVRFPLEEAIGGFTEIFKNRIVLPFQGNYDEFYHVLKHEMVHALVYDMSNFGNHNFLPLGRQGSFQFPLWVNEGLAEYLASGWDVESEFFMLDATTSGYVTSPIYNFGGFMAYKGGQLFFHYLQSMYGEFAIKNFIHQLFRTRDIEVAFTRVTGISLEEAGELWLRELRRIYWPELGQRSHGKSLGRKLTQHGKDLSFYNLQPAITPDGKEVAFFSDRGNREGIFLMDLKTEKISHLVLQGGSKGQHESFHSFKSGIAWDPQGKRLAIVSQKGGRDVIHILDKKTGKVLEEIVPTPIKHLLSPAWSADGKFLVFNGIQNGFSDIYLWDIKAQKLTRLTQDKAFDDKPCFSPSGKYLVFESNRSLDTLASRKKYLDLYLMNLETKTLEKAIQSPWDDKMPSFGPSDSSFLFVSNRSGLDNMYMAKKTDSGWTESPITNILSGVFTPSWSRDGKRLVFSLFEFGGWDLYTIQNPTSKMIDSILPTTHFMKVQENPNTSFFQKVNHENLSSFKVDSTKKDSLNSTPASKQDSLNQRKKPRSTFSNPFSPWNRSSLFEQAENESPVYAGPDSNEIKKLWLDSSQYIDQKGNYKVEKYKPQWSLDMANAGLGVSNFEGSIGQGYLVFSDLMGDQEISVGLNMAGTLNNYFLAFGYSYLPLQPDFGFNSYFRSYEETFVYRGSEKSKGVSALVSYPLSLFTRFQFDLSANSQERTGNFDTTIVLEGEPIRYIETYKVKSQVAFPMISFSHDNSQWGITGPVNGTRVLAQALMVPPLFDDDIFFYSADLDFRRYFLFRKKYSFVFRLNLGMSEALDGKENPRNYWLGGDDFINLYSSTFTTTNSNKVPKNKQLSTIYFSEFGVPLRGYPYFEFSGNRKILSNLEFRFPFIQELTLAWPLPISIQQVMGVLFSDYGAAWTRGSEFTDEQGLTWGMGLRLNMGMLVLRWSRAQPFSSVGSHKKSTQHYWSLGAEF